MDDATTANFHDFIEIFDDDPIYVKCIVNIEDSEVESTKQKWRINGTDSTAIINTIQKFNRLACIFAFKKVKL